jgi:hypothetical protein
MSSQVIPASQKQYLSVFNGRLFDFNTSDSRIYLAASINSLNRTVGTNCILQGLDITNTDYNPTTDIVTVTVSPGKCLIDNTLIEIPDPTVMELDVTSFDSAAGKLVVSIGFAYVETIYSNKATLKLRFVTNDGQSAMPGFWFLNYDHIIINVLDFDKIAKTVTLDNFDPMAEKRTITIQDREYEIAPLDSISSRVRHLLAP